MSQISFKVGIGLADRDVLFIQFREASRLFFIEPIIKTKVILTLRFIKPMCFLNHEILHARKIVLTSASDISI